MMTTEQLVGRRIKYFRENMGWTQEEFAREMRNRGVPWRQGTISRVEGGHVASVVRIDTLIILASVFRAPIPSFFEYIGPDIYDKHESVSLPGGWQVSPRSIRNLLTGNGKVSVKR